MTKLFKEIDQDRDGLVKYKEFEEFLFKDYDKNQKDIEKQKD